MISEKLHDQIEAEGRRKGFKIWECFGELDNDGNFSFVIRLIPTDERARPPDLAVNVSDGIGADDVVR